MPIGVLTTAGTTSPRKRGVFQQHLMACRSEGGTGADDARALAREWMEWLEPDDMVEVISFSKER